ncbi:MAG: Gfo/Idh/MocA family oxidoreductase [Verrucomicrobia bacterium]|nr:Gfo/Idh/MocA family oxidoreductase [Verrucomicrobiota bacterium]
MKNRYNRRLFLKHAALIGSATTASRWFSGPYLWAADAGKKLNIAQIGCGGRAMTHLDQVIYRQKHNLLAMVDVSEPQFQVVRNWLKQRELVADKAQAFTDYRKMFDKVGKDIDAVFIATPNHHHALPAMIAMQLGKAVYCEKPVCHDIGEARELRRMAAASKVPTQMGNQGHCMTGYRSLCEYIWSGVIGDVTETHSWTDRANGGEGPRPPVEPVPPGLHWDEYLGPAPYRDFHGDIHPHSWHGWYDFGNGSIGNMGCHVLDGVFWALKIDHPVSIEVEEMRGGSDERYPMGSRIRWDIPARAGMPPLKVYWYEGLKQDAKGKPRGNLRAAVGEDRNYPKLVHELTKQYPDEEIDRPDSGTLYVGTKGIIHTGTYGDRMHVVPWEKMKEIPVPEKTLPRPKDIFTDFLEAILGGKSETSVSFDYGTRLTEFAVLGNLAQHAGPGRKLEWDGPNMKVTNLTSLNAWVQRKPRPGWALA